MSGLVGQYMKGVDDFIFETGMVLMIVDRRHEC